MQDIEQTQRFYEKEIAHQCNSIAMRQIAKVKKALETKRSQEYIFDGPLEPGRRESALFKGFTSGKAYKVEDIICHDNSAFDYFTGKNTFILKNDFGQVVKVSDMYFSFPLKPLSCIESCEAEEDVDVRKLAKEQGVKPVASLEEDALTELVNKKLFAPAQDFTDNLSDFSSFHNDFDKITENINSVFKDCINTDTKRCLEKQPSPTDFLTQLCFQLPQRQISWKNGKLMVDNACTSYTYSQVEASIKGLENLMSRKQAERTIGRIISKNLKKVF